MTEKFRGKYRIPSARLSNWDYAANGAYFITICTKDRLPYLGNIHNGKMHLSNAGVIADICWQEIRHHTTNVMLDAFVVMPNPIHGILLLNGNGEHSIPNIIGSYKSAVTWHANRLQFPFAWQTRFYDHIIRNQQAFERIACYIAHNVANWAAHRFLNG